MTPLTSLRSIAALRYLATTLARTERLNYGRIVFLYTEFPRRVGAENELLPPAGRNQIVPWQAYRNWWHALAAEKSPMWSSSRCWSRLARWSKRSRCQWLGHGRHNLHEERRMKIDGHCHCGQITFEADVDANALTICHCTDC
jgi:hypothetical protein